MPEAKLSVIGVLVRGILVILTLAVAVLNGLWFSAVFDPVFFYLPRLLPAFLPISMDVVFHLTTVAIVLGTLAIAGVPAALYERVMGLRRSSVVSLCIWLAGTLLLSAPLLSDAMELI